VYFLKVTDNSNLLRTISFFLDMSINNYFYDVHKVSEVTTIL